MQPGKQVHVSQQVACPRQPWHQRKGRLRRRLPNDACSQIKEWGLLLHGVLTPGNSSCCAHRLWQCIRCLSPTTRSYLAMAPSAPVFFRAGRLQARRQATCFGADLSTSKWRGATSSYASSAAHFMSGLPPLFHPSQ
jgi:hypothetical protein